MKMETITVAPGERRVLLRFDPDAPSELDEKARAYLKANDLEPKREYRETYEGREHEVYYFGKCYIEGHLPQLAGMATESKP